jgi:hypothetical protein
MVNREFSPRRKYNIFLIVAKIYYIILLIYGRDYIIKIKNIIFRVSLNEK